MAKTIHSEAYAELVGALAAARRDAGLTQREVAGRLGRPQSYVAKVEGLERRLDVVEYLELATAIGTDPIPSLARAWEQLSIDALED